MITSQHVLSAALSASHASPESGASFWGEDGFGFGDILDAINPLQRLPVISNLYQEWTGDTCSAGSRMLGGALFGGVFGTLLSFFDITMQECTGKDLGGNMLDALSTSSAARNYAVTEPVEITAPALDISA